MNATIEKIKSRGFWKIIIRPSEFIPNRISNISECKSIVRDNSVLLRGWDYPHYDTNYEPTTGIDYVEQSVDWNIHIEAWRMYQSGQFVHYHALWEDWHELDTFWGQVQQIPPGVYLNLIGTVYLMTEIFEFSARLAAKGVLGDHCEIIIELNNTKSRQLKAFPVDRAFFSRYETALDNIPRKIQIPVNELIGRSTELALEQIEWLYRRFNWDNVNIAVFKEDQRKLLEKRL
jgi:hypothetical protein